MTNTTTAPPTTGLILALDRGTYKGVARLYRSAADQRFTTCATRRAEWTRLIDQQRPDVILIEACLLAGWVRDLGVEKGARRLVAHTTSEAWKFKHLKRQADRAAALRRAEVYRPGQFPSVNLPAKEVREKRGLIETRQKLVGRRVAVQNRMRAVRDRQGLAAPVGAKAWGELGRAGIATHARPLAECGPAELWRGRLHPALTELEHVKGLLAQAEKKLDALAKADVAVPLLETIPGVGPRAAEAGGAFLPAPKQFRTTEQGAAGGGFVPRQYQSTDTDHRGRITERGPKALRKLLVECAGVRRRYNAWARATYPRLTPGGKTRKKQAIVALARKLPVRCWALVRDGTAGRADPAPAAPT